MVWGTTRQALLAAILVLAGPAGQGHGARLRSRQDGTVGDLEVAEWRRRRNDTTPENDEVILEVVDNRSLTVEEMKECLCELGEFWHWRVKKCIKQGGWGYECGFFPAEHHHRVCKDGLTCKPVGGKDIYASHGQYEGTARSFPASCVDCTPEDNCKVGQERHDESCLKEYVLSGEACVTVRVKLPVSAEATATRSHTAKAEATKEATANATAQASSATQVTANATASHEASAEKTAESSHTAEAKREAVAEVTKCMSAKEALKTKGYKADALLSAVPAAEVASAADEKVFELASVEAKKLAAEKGLTDAKASAKKVAGEEAAEKARLKAEAAAREAAAWEAEARADKKAKEAAEERAKDLAKQAEEEEEKPAEKPAEEPAEEPTTEKPTEKPAETTTKAPPKPDIPPGPPVKEPLVPPQKPVEESNKFRKITDKQFEDTRP